MKIIKFNNFQNRIFLTHKVEANYIKNIIINNSSLLVKSDVFIENINFESTATKNWSSNPNNMNMPSFDSRLERSFYEISTKLEEEYQKSSFNVTF